MWHLLHKTRPLQFEPWKDLSHKKILQRADSYSLVKLFLPREFCEILELELTRRGFWERNGILSWIRSNFSTRGRNIAVLKEGLIHARTFGRWQKTLADLLANHRRPVKEFDRVLRQALAVLVLRKVRVRKASLQDNGWWFQRKGHDYLAVIRKIWIQWRWEQPMMTNRRRVEMMVFDAVHSFVELVF